MEEMENMSTENMLSEVKKAIKVILIGGQSYKIGSRELTRADLAQLRALKKDLDAELASEAGAGLMANTVVAFFDGR